MDWKVVSYWLSWKAMLFRIFITRKYLRATEYRPKVYDNATWNDVFRALERVHRDVKRWSVLSTLAEERDRRFIRYIEEKYR